VTARPVQLDLLGERDALGLSPRQRFALDLLAAHRDGLDADEVGAAWHAERGKHGADTRCAWCARDGASILRELRHRGLAAQRRALQSRWVATRTGGEEPRREQAAQAAPSGTVAAVSSSPSATGDLPENY